MAVHFSITFLVLFFCFVFRNNQNKLDFILPISMTFIGIYWAIEYDYGLDYWNYYNIFYFDHDYPNRHGDALFWSVMFFFDKYYKFVFFYGISLSVALYYIVKRHLSGNYYWLFFLIFMLHPSLCLNMSYAFRTSSAACIIWYGFLLFYVEKYRLVPLVLSIILAAQFHHSMLVFLILPFIDYFILRINKNYLILFLFLSLFVGAFYSSVIFGKVTNSIEAFENYNHYGDDRISNVSLIMLLSRAVQLIPAYFFVMYLKDRDIILSKLCVLCLIYYYIYLSGLDMLGRFTTTLYIFVIIASTKIILTKNRLKTALILVPSIIFALQRNVQFYMDMLTSYIANPGNMVVYKNIFELSNFP